jgi:hypothetical protein
MSQQWEVNEHPVLGNAIVGPSFSVYRTLREGVYEFWPNRTFASRGEAQSLADDLNEAKEAFKLAIMLARVVSRS